MSQIIRAVLRALDTWMRTRSWSLPTVTPVRTSCRRTTALSGCGTQANLGLDLSHGPRAALLLGGILAIIGVLPSSSLHAQGESESSLESGPLEFVAPKTFEMQVGLRVSAADGNMLGTTAMTVFPTSWPEQKVEIVQVNVGPPWQNAFRELPGGNQQLLLQARIIPAGATVEATVQVRIEKKHILGPSDEDTLQFVIPRRIPKDIRQYMGNSPYIEANSSQIRKIVRDIDAQEPLTDWKRVEMMYDWVRENIEYEEGELKTVRECLSDGTGDCEEMTSTFIALCRAARIPARMVWLPNHCYPEFYLEDDSGQGHWFPCQVAGTRNFGSMPEYLPILQKGDRFKVPEKTDIERYLADYLKSQKVLGRGKPQVTFIRQLLGDANLAPPIIDGADLPAANPLP
jgi:hypothetical protein